MVSHNGKMPEADVAYSKFSDIRFRKSNGVASTWTVATYSQINVLKAASTTELPGSQQRAESSRGSKVRPERVVIAVLSGLLAAAVIALGFIYFKNLQTTERFQKLTVEHEAVKKNLTEKRCEVCEVKTCSPVQTNYRPPPVQKVPTEPTPTCDDGWELHGNKCYYFSSNKSPWNDARVRCQRQGADLVQIDSEEEQSFLERKLRDEMNEAEDKFWIGLTDSQKEGTWLWVDGSQLKNSSSFWSSKEPDNWPGEDPDGEDCVRMGEKSGAADLKCWFDKSCKKPHRRICEKPGSLKCI